LSGDGPAFSTGLDVASVTSQPARLLKSFVPWCKSTNLFQQACWAWRKLPMPVVAVLHGHCYGGALQLALGADFRFSTPDCKFSIMEIKRSEEHTSELQSRFDLVCRLLLEKKKE